MRLEQLSLEHQDAILEFEILNREYFVAWIPDRGDDFFADYPARHRTLLQLQADGTDRFHVLVTDDGAIAGRVNITHISDGEAELGYRIGRAYAGQGLATKAVHEVCELARREYGITLLRAGAGEHNPASIKVLLRNGFTLQGEEKAADGHTSYQFARPLAP